MTDPSTIHPPRRRKRPDVRSAEIVEAAARIFVRDGYAGFTLRAVASEVGIRLSSLQHHFPSRETLLMTTLDLVMADWGSQFHRIAETKEISPLKRLKAILQLNLDLIVTQPSAPLLWELFALAQHEEFALNFAQKAYFEFRQIFADLLAEVRPDLGRDQLMAHATLIVSQTEGLTLFMQPGDPAGLPVASIRQALDSFAEGLLKEIAREPSTSA